LTTPWPASALGVPPVFLQTGLILYWPGKMPLSHRWENVQLKPCFAASKTAYEMLMALEGLQPMDLIERLIVYRDRPGRSREGRELLAEACNEIIAQRNEVARLTRAFERMLDELIPLKRKQ
jgi:hypothetical protein